MGDKLGIGVDIGSTATKVAVLDGTGALVHTELMPTGFSSVDAAERVAGALRAAGFPVDDEGVRVVATGYGRIAVPYANKIVTEITCHGIGPCACLDRQGPLSTWAVRTRRSFSLKAGALSSSL